MSIDITVVRVSSDGPSVRPIEGAPSMNLANGNFVTLWSALGLDPTPCGTISPEDLNDALELFDPELAIRAPRDYRIGDYGPRIIEHGTTYSQIQGYVDSLLNIVGLAHSLGAQIGWC